MLLTVIKWTNTKGNKNHADQLWASACRSTGWWIAKIVPCTMYSSDKTEFPGSSMFVSNSICKVTVRLVVPRTRRLLDLADDVDGPTVTSESTMAVPFISQPFTIWISTCEHKTYRKTSVVIKSGRSSDCKSRDDSSDNDRDKDSIGVRTTNVADRCSGRQQRKIEFVLTGNGDSDARPGTRRRYVNYPRKNSNLNDWNNLMIILIIDAHITIINDRLINITPPPARQVLNHRCNRRAPSSISIVTYWRARQSIKLLR